MKKIFSILLLLFFIGGNFSWAANTCSSIPPTVVGHSYTCENPSEVPPSCGEGATQSCKDGSAYGCASPFACCTCVPPTTPAAPLPPGQLPTTGGNDTLGGSTQAPGTGAPAGATCDENNDCASGTCDIQVPATQGTCAGSATASPGTVGASCSAESPCVLPAICDTTTNKCISGTSPSNSDLPPDQTVYGITIGPKCLLNGQCKFNIYDALGIRKSVRNEGDPTSVGIFVQDIVLSATMFIGTIVTIAIIVSGLMRIMAGATGKDPTKAKSGLINSLIGLLIVTSSYLIIRLVQYVAKGF